MKPGPKPKGKVLIKWSPEFAYAIGLIVSDGCLQKDKRHIDFTSTDKELIHLFNNCLHIENRIGIKYSSNGNQAYRVQFSDVLFYNFLLSIGITPAKSRTIKQVDVPDIFFRDFLRGLFDGDGSSYDYYDPIFKKSFRFYISFASASDDFVEWLMNKVRTHIPVSGYISRTYTTSFYQLKYAKRDAKKVSEFMYWDRAVPYLKRKRLKIRRALRIMGER